MYGAFTRQQQRKPSKAGTSAENLNASSQIQFFQAQEPGPSGLPHDPQGLEGIGDEEAEPPFAETAKTDNFGSSFLLSHLGQAALSLP